VDSHLCRRISTTETSGKHLFFSGSVMNFPYISLHQSRHRKKPLTFENKHSYNDSTLFLHIRCYNEVCSILMAIQFLFNFFFFMFSAWTGSRHKLHDVQPLSCLNIQSGVLCHGLQLCVSPVIFPSRLPFNIDSLCIT